MLYRAADSRPIARGVQQAVACLADRMVIDAVAACRPTLIVSFHPLAGRAASRARDAAAPTVPVVALIA